jgi:cyanobactin maturation PatA/PatG family protease
MQPAPECGRLFRGRLNIPGAVKMLDAKVGTTMVDTAVTMETGSTSFDTAVRPSGSTAGEVPGGAVTPAALDAPPDAPAGPREGGVVPADCGCGGAGGVVFAIGTLGFDFGSESSRDAFYQANGGPIYTNADLHAYLVQNPSEASALIWTLGVDSYPVYAIRPSGPFADVVYTRLVAFLGDAEVERVSLPGWARGGAAALLSGQEIPVIEPDLGALSSWSTDALVAKLLEDHPPPRSVSRRLLRDALGDYLSRIYYGRHRAGLSPEDRALNFSATNAYLVYQILTQTVGAGLELCAIDLERSPLCRPESNCWDVKLTFFDPLNPRRRPRQVFRFTVDVSDVEPVQIGTYRTWQIH